MSDDEGAAVADPIAARPVRPGLIGLLAATAGLTGAALWWEPEPVVSADGADSAVADRQTDLMAVAQAGPARLPSALPRLSLPAMAQDPFAGTAPPVPMPLPATPPPPAAEAPPSPAPPAAPPPAEYRYLGSFVGTDGQPRLFVARAEQHHELVIGNRLPDGYVVESVGPPSIRLRHAVMDAVAEIPVPPAPEAAR